MRELTENQCTALIAWAEEQRREGGCSGHGPKFDAAMAVAEQLRKRLQKEICDTCKFWGGAGEFGICFGLDPADRTARTDKCGNWKKREPR